MLELLRTSGGGGKRQNKYGNLSNNFHIYLLERGVTCFFLSDLHISAGMPAMIRTDGEMTRINMPAMTHQVVHQLIYDIMNDKQRADFEEFFESL